MEFQVILHFQFKQRLNLNCFSEQRAGMSNVRQVSDWVPNKYWVILYYGIFSFIIYMHSKSNHNKTVEPLIILGISDFDIVSTLAYFIFKFYCFLLSSVCWF